MTRFPRLARNLFMSKFRRLIIPVLDMSNRFRSWQHLHPVEREPAPELVAVKFMAGSFEACNQSMTGDQDLRLVEALT